VFIDFPEDDNLAAVRVVSIQFFNDVRRLLRRHGVFVIQNDFHENPAELALHAYNTLKKAGFHAVYGGKHDSNKLGHYAAQLAAFRQKETLDAFLKGYAEYKPPAEVAGQPEFTGVMAYFTVDSKRDARVISFYDPLILKSFLTGMTEEIW